MPPIYIRFTTIIIMMGSLGYILGGPLGTAWALFLYSITYSTLYTWFRKKEPLFPKKEPYE